MMDESLGNASPAKRARLDTSAELPEAGNSPNSPISNHIKFPEMKCIVLVWCPSEQVRCDIVATLLTEFGKVQLVQDRWINRDISSKALDTWGGFLVTYDTQEQAEAAAKGIPMRSRYVRTLLLNDLINRLAEYESSFPDGGAGDVELLVCNRFKLDDKHKRTVAFFLHMLGVVNSVKFPTEILKPSPDSNLIIVCRATYMYPSQAFAALFVLQGRKIGSTILSTHICANAVAEDTYRKLCECVSMHLDEASFPHRK